MTVTLPEELKGKEYEEAVAAYLKANGYFIEKRAILRHKGRELFELDIVASPSNEHINDRILIDAKSGRKTGFSDIFKIYGWRMFLDIPKGCVIRKNKPDENDIITLENYYNDLKMSWEVFNLEDVALDISTTFPTVFSITDELVIHHFLKSWWFSIAERIAFTKYQCFTKSCEDKKLVEKVKKYETVCNLSFFEKSPLKRVKALYEAFKENPRITNECIKYLSTQTNKSERSLKNEIFETEKHLWVQYVSLLEHRARYLIIKCAVELLQQSESIIGWAQFSKEHLFSTTPENFKKGYYALNKSKHLFKIPNLLQVFIESFGGFYIESNDDDLRLLSEITDIPLDDIVECLNIIDIFFPTSGNGWFFSSKDLKIMKCIPAFARGIGSFMRKEKICEDYDEASSMGWLMWKYHNSVIEVLANDKSLHQNK